MKKLIPRPPEYRISAKLGNRTRNVGAAWLDEDTGRISLRFDPFTTLPLDDPKLILSLFPNETPAPSERKPALADSDECPF